MLRRLLVTILVSGLSLGCFVLDELDAGLEMMDNPHFGNAPAKKEVEPQPDRTRPEQESPSPSAVAARLAKWWKEEARTLGSEEVDEDLVRCTLAGATQFMRRSNCLARGGNAESARRN